MKRSIQTSQRKVRQLHFTCNAAGTAITGLDQNQVTMADTGTGIKTITLNTAFADAEYSVQVTSGTALTVANSIITSSSVFVVDSITASTGAAVDSIVHVTVTGSDITDKY
jgi:hypothetical protein